MSTNDNWQWDPSLFAGAAPYYDQGRIPYAPGLAEAFTDELGADGSGRLLDVGCGPGTVSLRLAPRYREIVGLDADVGMIEEARRLAAERSIGNATFVLARAEELPLDLGRFDVVTFAASFHWMDRPLVAATVRRMLTTTGVVVHVDVDRSEPDRADDLHPPPPDDAIGALVRRYLGDQRRAGQFVGFVSPGDEDVVWRAAGFAGPTIVRVPSGVVLARTVDDVEAATLSMSSCAPHLFGPRLDEFRGDLRAVLDATARDGLFDVHVPDTVLKVWTPE